MTKHFTIAILMAMLWGATAVAAGPTIDIVVAEKAEPLEKFAAEELAGQLKKLFDAEVRIGAHAPAGAANVVLLGNPTTHAGIKDLNLALPKLSDQVYALKSVKLGDKTVLAVVGGSPQTVLWAAYELGWRHGVRYFLFGDLYPTAPPAFTTAGFDVMLKPASDKRTWIPEFSSPIHCAAWGRAELGQELRAFVKLRYQAVHLSFETWRQGVERSGLPILITGDTMGRTAFRGKRSFDNPDLEGAADIEGRNAEGRRLVAAVQRDAESLGLKLSAGEQLKPTTDGDVLPLAHVEFYMIAQSRFDVDPQATLASVYAEVLTPVCGEEVHLRVKKAFDLCAEAAALTAKHDVRLGEPNKNMLLRHHDDAEPPPAWWGEVRTDYLNAMNEMYRANTRAREGGRAFTLYYARRFEFGFEYMNVVEAIRKAGIAKRKGDKETQIAELEKAIDSVTNACNAMAAVARNQSDRGVIAVMNEYGYRPLLKLLEEADSEN